MYPTFGSVFGEPIPAYFTMLLVGFVLSVGLGVRWARRSGLDHEVMIDLGLASLVAGVAGARIAHVLFDGHLQEYVDLCFDPSQVAWPTIPFAQCEGLGGAWDRAAGVCRPASADCFAWAKFWQGGLVWYGGLAGAGAYGLHLLRRERFPVWKALDLTGMVIPFGLFFGRLGCFFGGCCFGHPTDHWTALSFPPGSPATDAQVRDGLLSSAALPSLSVYPTQLFEAGGALLLAALLMLVVQPRKRFDGQVFCLSLGLYAALRFFLELFRADDRGGTLGLSTSQWIGVLLGLALIGLYRHLAARAEARLAAPLDEGPSPGLAPPDAADEAE